MGIRFNFPFFFFKYSIERVQLYVVLPKGKFNCSIVKEKPTKCTAA